jgi:hypothetical protein
VGTDGDPLQGLIQPGLEAGSPSLAAEALRLWRLRGVPPHRQAADVLRLVWLRRQMTLREYFSRLPPEYDARRRDPPVEEFVGEQGSGLWINRALRAGVPEATLALLQDKLATAAALRAIGLAAPRTRAVFRSDGGPVPGDAVALRDAAALAAFLRAAAGEGLFGKPMAEDMSLGVVALTGHDAATGSLLRLGRPPVAASALAARIAEAHPRGYLLQDMLRQAPAVEAICGRAVGTLRVVCLREPGGAPRIAYAAWKIPAPDAATDHPDLPGALIADIDPGSGRIRRLQQGFGLDATLTDGAARYGRPLAGAETPGWAAAAEASLRAMAIAPEAMVIGWDVALCAEGPVLVEGNWRPSHTAYQAASGRGALGHEIAAAARRRGAEARALSLAAPRRGGRPGGGLRRWLAPEPPLGWD